MAGETVVLLHGFGGTRRAWDPVLPHLEHTATLALDLPGHGELASTRPVDFATCVDVVLAAAPVRFALCGYSFGGRVALHVALAAPERVSRLVLAATTAGIDDPAERAARVAEDERFAADLETMTIEQYADRWQALPLFAGTPPEAARWWREDLLRNDPRGLAAALRGTGAGVMEVLWDRLGGLTMPATVVAGDRDAKFVALGERLVAGLPDARLVVIPGAGHGLPREAPAELAAAIEGRA